MWLYLMIFLVPIVMAFQAPRVSHRGWGLAAFYLLLWLFTGLRFEVGADWIGYTYILQWVEQADWGELFQAQEPGFFLINKIASELGWGQIGVNAICAALFLFGIFRFARSTANPWLATAAVVPYLVYIVSMSGIRQSTAIGLSFLALSRWQSSSVVWKLVLIAAAASIHSSAVIFLVFILWDGGKYPLVRAVLGSALLVAAARYLGESGASSEYASRYLAQNIESGGAFYHVGLSALPAALYLLFRRQITAHGWQNDLVLRASFIALALMPLVLLSSTGASRLSLYMSFVQMWAFPAFVAAHGKRWVSATTMCAVYLLAVFIVYFTLGTHVYTYLPYRSVFWQS